MAGRGGRGAALLQALGAPARPPGQAAATQNSQQQNGHGPVPPGQQPPAAQGQQQTYQPRAPYQQAPQVQQPQQTVYQPQPCAPYQPQPRAPYQQQGPIQQQQRYPTASQQRYPTPSQLQGTGRGYQAGPSQGAQPPAANYGRGAATTQLPYGRGAQAPSSQTPTNGHTAPQVQPAAYPLSPPGQGVQQAPRQRTPSPPQSKATSPQALEQKMGRMGLEEAQRTQTTEKGSSGKPVMLSANYIPIHSPNMGVFQYCVSFSPEIDSRGMRFHLLMKQHSEFLGTTRQFDGASLYLPFKLDQPTTTLESVRPTDGEKITINVTLTRVVQPDECLQFYNIIFKRVMRSLEMEQVGRYYYDPKRPAVIPQHKLELWPGYITAIQHYEGGLMLLADVSHKLLRTETILSFMIEQFNRHKDRFQDETTRQLVGAIVLTRYNNRTYRIDDIEWGKNPMCTFPTHTGEEITYVEYYKKTYNKEIKDLKQPLLVHNPKKTDKTKSKLQQILLIPEFCCMTGLTDNMRQDFKVMKDIAVHTRVTPNQRQEAMRKFIENINSSPAALQHLSSWGLKLDMSLLKVEGRQLQSEKILFGSTSITSNAQADFGREAVKEQVITPVNLNCWMVVFVRRDQGKALDYVTMMKKVTPAMGISVNDPQMLEVRDDRTETYLRSIRENLHPQVQVVVVIFPTSRDDRYAAVKKLCCVESPVPSQVINARTISQQNKLRSVTQKIALQINVKLGGELWALTIPSSTLMVVGIDVYHDAARGGRSVGGFVASTNKSLTRWYSRVCFQSPGQELIDGLKMCLTASLKKYHEINHALPERIIVYRDGVGDGQLPTVAGYEVQQLSECFGLFGEKYEPKMAVVVVQKRINTRIFSVMGNGPTPRLDNPGPGTVLDHTVTRKDWYDFYLVSQHVRQGTVTPTHYVVVHDKSGWKPDIMQKLSYKLTHLYYNWPGTVRVPAPCQYAHKLAFQVGQCIHREPSHELSDRLFFL